MSDSKRLTFLVLALEGTTIAFLLYALNWTKSAGLGELPPLLTVGGNFHPILLHLPIGVFLYLGFTEAWNCLDRTRFKRGPIKGGLPILAFGTVTAVLAALAGLLLYLQGDYSGELIHDHMNWGIAFAISSIVVFCCALIFQKNPQVYRVVLLLSIITLTVAGHQGGLMTHGDPLKPLFNNETDAIEAKPVEAITAYEVVDKIFRAKCYDCHSVGKKQKGGLLMDSYEALLAGGKKGDALVPGSLEASKISTYPHLPLEDDLHMPPEGKPQLTDKELEFIDAWVLAGATPDGRLVEQEFPEELDAWAIVYMETAPLEREPESDSIDVPKEAQVDLAPLIAVIEQHALNSVTRVGPEGQHLVFSAVNARDTFDDAGLAALVAVAPYLIDIDLSYTKVSTDAVAELLQATTQLERLNLSGTQVDRQTIEALVSIKPLESLILFEAQLAPDALPALKQLYKLRRLHLAGTGLAPEEIRTIRRALSVEVVADDFLNKHSPEPSEEAASSEE